MIEVMSVSWIERSASDMFLLERAWKRTGDIAGGGIFLISVFRHVDSNFGRCKKYLCAFYHRG